jgi:hypothetical protein
VAHLPDFECSLEVSFAILSGLVVACSKMVLEQLAETNKCSPPIPNNRENFAILLHFDLPMGNVFVKKPVVCFADVSKEFLDLLWSVMFFLHKLEKVFNFLLCLPVLSSHRTCFIEFFGK